MSEFTVVVDFVSVAPPLSVVVVLVVSDLVSPLASADGFASAAPLSPFAVDLAPLLRKSVTYQPDPFNWKPAAETFLASADALHAGH